MAARDALRVGTPERAGAPVPIRTRLAYAGPAFALAVFGIPIYVFLPIFYTDVVGVSAGFVGLAMVLLRLSDAFTDIGMGFLSDRTQTRYGRRRPWIGAASLPLAVSVVALLAPPVGIGSYGGLWFAGWYFLVFLFWTAVQVPYESLGPEITPSYHERTSVLAVRDGFLVAGTLVAAVAPYVLQEGFGFGQRDTFLAIGLVYGPVVVLLCWLCAAAVRERAPERAQPPLTLAGVRSMLRNRPFAILLASYTVSALGSSLPSTLLLYFAQYVLGAEPGSEGMFLILYLLPGFLFLPAWVWLAHRIGKKAAWLTSMGVNTGAFIGVFLLGAGDTTAFAVLCVLSGLGFGATLALPSAMQADVIDYDELCTGERREGLLYGLWALARKAMGVTAGFAIAILGFVGYEPNAVQSDEVLLTIRSLYALIPSLLNVVAAGIALAYPIDQETHRAIREAIERRRAGEPVQDPVRGTTLPGLPR